MQNKLMEILACQRCLGVLELKDALFETGNREIIKGRLCCERCGLDFIVEGGVPIFGIGAENKAERNSEMDGEIEWEFTTNIQGHIAWAKRSSLRGEAIIRKCKKRLKKINRIPKVLDVGAGVGALHSWQLSKHGFEVVATELCPEFLFSIDYLTEDMFFERVVTDCTILPFRDNSFDIVFCKELIHHLENPMKLLSEMWRVLRPNGLIVIREPCISILRNKKETLEKDSAARMGITHHYYTYTEYLNYIKEIASNMEIDGEMITISSLNHPILSRIQKHVIKYDNIKRLLLKIQLVFVGGSVELIGVKRGVYAQEKNNRVVIPIDTQRLNLNARQIKFYRGKLIPALLEIFSEA